MTTSRNESVNEPKTEGHIEGIPEPFRVALEEIDNRTRLVAESIRKVEKTLRKPLPQILDEMDDNIRAVAEATRHGEEAAREARKAAEMAVKASEIAAQRAVNARKAAQKTAANATKVAAQKIRTMEISVLQRVESIEKKLAELEDALPKEEVVVLREVTRNEAKAEIERLFSQRKPLYYSDIAKKLRIDLELVVNICEELIQEGKVTVDKGTRKGRGRSTSR